MRYTIRNVPPNLDRLLRRRAQPTGRSLNDVVLEALVRDVGLSAERVKRRSLAELAGTWVEDPEFDAAIRDQDVVDPITLRRGARSP